MLNNNFYSYIPSGPGGGGPGKLIIFCLGVFCVNYYNNLKKK